MSKAIVFKEVPCFLEQAPWVLNPKLTLVKGGLGGEDTYSRWTACSKIDTKDNQGFSKTASVLKEEFQKTIRLNIRQFHFIALFLYAWQKMCSMIHGTCEKRDGGTLGMF